MSEEELDLLKPQLFSPPCGTLYGACDSYGNKDCKREDDEEYKKRKKGKGLTAEELSATYRKVLESKFVPKDIMFVVNNHSPLLIFF